MPRMEDSNPLVDGGRRGPSWGKILAVVVCVVLALVVAGYAGIYYFGRSLMRSTNYQADEDVMQFETLPEEQTLDTETEEVSGTSLNESELDAIHARMNQVQTDMSTDDVIMDQSVYNVILVGVDRTDKDWNGNSDSMMLVSINNDKKRVSVISLMRDTYVEIPGHDYNKLNASYAYGGGPLLCDTIEENYRIELDRYAAVDFENLVDIIDDLGGVELEWTASEIEVANGYIMDMCERVLDIPYEDHIIVEEPGLILSDGVQAVAYARNRFVGNSDYTRTQRQRYVMQQMTEKIRQMSATELFGFAMKVLPLITHNIPEDEIWSLVADAPSILEYDFVQDRVPYDGLYEVVDINGQGMLVPDWEETIAQMKQTIYGDGSVSDNADNSETEVETEFTDEFLENYYTGLSGQEILDGTAADAAGGQSESTAG